MLQGWLGFCKCHFQHRSIGKYLRISLEGKGAARGVVVMEVAMAVAARAAARVAARAAAARVAGRADG